MAFSRNALVNLKNRYNAVLKKCYLINTFGSIALAMSFVAGSSQEVKAETITTRTLVTQNTSTTKGDMYSAQSTQNWTGGAFAVTHNVALTVTGNSFLNNTIGPGKSTGVTNGGAIFLESYNTKNTEPEETGGWLILTGDTIFSNNYATASDNKGGRGGAIAGEIRSVVNFYSGTQVNFTSNAAKGNDGLGGAIYAYGGRMVFSNNLSFLANSATGSGGAVYNAVTQKSKESPLYPYGIYFEGTTVFSENKAEVNGGAVDNEGVYSGESQGCIISFSGENTFIGNQAGGKGGALYNAAGGTVYFTGSNVFGYDSENAVLKRNYAGSIPNDIYNAGTINITGGVTSLYSGYQDEKNAVLNLSGATLEIRADSTILGTLNLTKVGDTEPCISVIGSESSSPVLTFYDSTINITDSPKFRLEYGTLAFNQPFTLPSLEGTFGGLTIGTLDVSSLNMTDTLTINHGALNITGTGSTAGGISGSGTVRVRENADLTLTKGSSGTSNIVLEDGATLVLGDGTNEAVFTLASIYIQGTTKINTNATLNISGSSSVVTTLYSTLINKGTLGLGDGSNSAIFNFAGFSSESNGALTVKEKASVIFCISSTPITINTLSNAGTISFGDDNFKTTYNINTLSDNSGSITISSGNTVNFTDNITLDGSTGTFTNNGTMGLFGAANTISKIDGTGSITVNSGAGLTFTSTADSNSISLLNNSGTVTFGSGTNSIYNVTTLSSANNNLTVSIGNTLKITDEMTITQNIGTLTNNGVLELSGSNNRLFGLTNNGTFNIVSGTTSLTDKLNQTGGRTLVSSESLLTLASLSFSDSSVAEDGGSLYSLGSVTISGTSTFDNNATTKLGGAVYINGESNTTNAGSIYFEGAAEFTRNTAAMGGAVVNAYGGMITFESAAAFGNDTGNQNTAQYGGAFFNGNNSFTKFFGVTSFKYNTATAASDSDPAIDFKGGALYNKDGDITFSKTATFSKNSAETKSTGTQAESAFGGAVYNEGTITFTESSSFTDNKALNKGIADGYALGGAVYNTGTIHFNAYSAFETNTASNKGGALYNSNSGTVYFRNGSRFNANTVESTTGEGGAIYNNGIIYFYGNNTFTGNTSHNGNDIYNTNIINIEGGYTSLNGGYKDTIDAYLNVKSGAILNLCNSDVLGTLSLTSTDIVKAQVTFTGLSNTVDSINGSGEIIVNTSAELQAGNIAGSGTITVDTGGKLIDYSGTKKLNLDWLGNIYINQSAQLTVDKINNLGTITLGSGGVATTNQLTGSGEININGGTLTANSLSGTETITISNDGTLTANSLSGTEIITISSGTLTAPTEDLGSGSTITNNGKLNTWGNLPLNISGGGSTYIGKADGSGASLIVTENKTISGTLNLNNNVLDMQDEGTTKYSTLNVGTLAGSGNFAIDVDLTKDATTGKAVASDKIGGTTIATGTSITINNIRASYASGLTLGTTYTDYVKVLDLNGQSGTVNLTVSYTTTDGQYNYEFSAGSVSSGKGYLNVSVNEYPVTVKEYITAVPTTSGGLNETQIKALSSYNINSYSTYTNLGTTAKERTTDYTLTININNQETLNGKSGDNYGIGATVAADASNPFTLNVNGSVSGSNYATITGYQTALTVNSGCTLNIENILLTDNSVKDIDNFGTVIISGGTVMLNSGYTGADGATLNINSGASLVINAASSMSHAININSGASLLINAASTMNNAVIGLENGILNINGSGTYSIKTIKGISSTPASGTLSFGSSAQVSADEITLDNSTVTIKDTASLAVTDTLTITSTDFTSNNGNTLSFGSLVVADNSSINASSAPVSITGASGLELTESKAEVASLDVTQGSTELEDHSSLSITSGNMNVAGNAELSGASSLSLTSGDLTVTGDVEIDGSSTLTFLNTSSKMNVGNFASVQDHSTLTAGDVTVNGSDGFSVADNSQVSVASLNVAAGNFVLDDNSSMNVSGKVTVNGDASLYSDSTLTAGEMTVNGSNGLTLEDSDITVGSLTVAHSLVLKDSSSITATDAVQADSLSIAPELTGEYRSIMAKSLSINGDVSASMALVNTEVSDDSSEDFHVGGNFSATDNSLFTTGNMTVNGADGVTLDSSALTTKNLTAAKLNLSNSSVLVVANAVNISGAVSSSSGSSIYFYGSGSSSFSGGFTKVGGDFNIGTDSELSITSGTFSSSTTAINNAGTVSLSGTTTFSSNGTDINNSGTVNLSGSVAFSDNTTNINNTGKFNISGTITTPFKIVQSGTNSSTTVANGVSLNLTNATFTGSSGSALVNAGIITFSGTNEFNSNKTDIENSGTVIVENSLELHGGYTDTKDAQLTITADTTLELADSSTISGTCTNNGFLNLTGDNKYTIAKLKGAGTLMTNSSTITGGDLEIGCLAAKNSTITADTIKLHKSSSIFSNTALQAGEVTIGYGTEDAPTVLYVGNSLSRGGDTFIADKLVMSENTCLIVDPQQDSLPSIAVVENITDTDSSSSSLQNGKLAVGQNGVLSSGANFTDFRDMFLTAYNDGAYKDTGNTAIFTIAQPLNITGGSSSILVDGSQTDTSLLASLKTMKNGSITFADKSLLIMDTRIFGEDAKSSALKADSITISGNSKLYMANIIKTGKVYIANAKTLKKDDSAWNGDNLFLDKSNKILTISCENDDHSVWVTIGSKSFDLFLPRLDAALLRVLSKMPAIDADIDSENYGARFVYRAINYLDSDTAAATIEGAAKLVFASAVPQLNLSLANKMNSAMISRDFLSSDPVGGAVSNEDEKGFALWAAPLYEYESGHSFASGSFMSGYDASLGGMALGADYTTDNALRFGMAINGGGGNATSSGEYNDTRNTLDFYGINFYSSWKCDNFSLFGQIGWLHTDNDVSQHLPDQMNMGSNKADIKSNDLYMSLRASWLFNTDWMDIIPHLGLEYHHLQTSGFDVTNENHFLLHSSKTYANLLQFPIGLTMKKNITNRYGWNISAMLDVSAIPVMGNRKATVNARINPLTEEANIGHVISDSFSGRATVGLKMQKNNFSVGIDYTFQADKHIRNHGVQGVIGWKF